MAASNQLPAYTVKYQLFPVLNLSEDCAVTFQEVLEELAENYIAKLSSELSSYIWHTEAFNLQASVGERGCMPHLMGVTCFDDNTEDEWFIVYLLLRLTREDENLVVKIEDNDGEFLLIEAAEHIPTWLEADTSENRVFLYQGSLHIIPKAGKKKLMQCPVVLSKTPTIPDALFVIRQYPSLTEASEGVQEVIQNRINGYPERIREYQHKAHCYVPASVAAILKEEPRLLSEAVRAFHHKTPLDIEACKAMKHFPPEMRVMTEVVFTRNMYAQLLSQKYEPDRRVGWNLPQPNDPCYKSHNLGMKLACGFEIIMCSDSDKPSIGEENLRERDFNDDCRWKRFLKSLNAVGYFKGEIEGSKLYCKQLEQAKELYMHSLKKGSVSSCSPSNKKIKNLLETHNISYEELKESEKNLPEAEDDSWMDMTLQELFTLLDAKFNPKT